MCFLRLIGRLRKSSDKVDFDGSIRVGGALIGDDRKSGVLQI